MINKLLQLTLLLLGFGLTAQACGYYTNACNCKVTTSAATTGVNATITNYPLQTPTRNYLPTFYLSQRPIQSAQGGKGASDNFNATI